MHSRSVSCYTTSKPLKEQTRYPGREGRDESYEEQHDDRGNQEDENGLHEFFDSEIRHLTHNKEPHSYRRCSDTDHEIQRHDHTKMYEVYTNHVQDGDQNWNQENHRDPRLHDRSKQQEHDVEYKEEHPGI